MMVWCCRNAGAEWLFINQSLRRSSEKIEFEGLGEGDEDEDDGVLGRKGEAGELYILKSYNIRIYYTFIQV